MPLSGIHVPPSRVTQLRNSFLASSDGQRHLVVSPIEDTASFPITVMLNWTSLPKR